ncbi:hypothetical protein FKM82_024871 [Ascaphus truei]
MVLRGVLCNEGQLGASFCPILGARVNTIWGCSGNIPSSSLFFLRIGQYFLKILRILGAIWLYCVTKAKFTDFVVFLILYFRRLDLSIAATSLIILSKF